jgi:hypothetical protein
VDERLAALRGAGALQQAAAPLLQAEALARRIAGQPPAVRALLEVKLAAALDRLEATVQAPAPTQAPPVPVPRRIVTRAPVATADRGAWESLAPMRSAPSELSSVGRFRRAWSATRAQEQVVQATLRKPSNAGPLNSEALVVQSLAAMQALSPAYLRHFIAHVETLQWLEAATLPSAPAAASRRRKKKD